MDIGQSGETFNLYGLDSPGRRLTYTAVPPNELVHPENYHAHSELHASSLAQAIPSSIALEQSSLTGSSGNSFHVTAASTSTLATSSRSTVPSRSELKSENASLENTDLTDLSMYIPVGVLTWPNLNDEEGRMRYKFTKFPAEEIQKLENCNWIRTRVCIYENSPEWCYVRIYVLPDDIGRKLITRSNPLLRRALKAVMEIVDRSPEAWEGRWREDKTQSVPDRTEEESLWYIFNTLQDPNPLAGAVRDPYARRAMRELLWSSVAGLKTPLYPYQSRSAATMVQREAQPAYTLDPRFETCYMPNGGTYYYDKYEGSVLREKRLYSEACGGILAETMGCGKTLICLALILATRGHFPRIPPHYQQLESPVRPKTASLVEMAAATAGRLSLPWKGCFDSLSRCGTFHEHCIKACEANCGAYSIPSYQTKYEGRSAVHFPRPPPRHIRLCSGTLIVVPPNLVDHWQHEIAQHTEGLKVLTLQSYREAVPPPNELAQCDIVLFSRLRFEREAGEFIDNRRVSTPQGDSPLLRLHWLRIIVDEGHNVAGSGSRTVMVHLLNQLCIERRWAVSGTPSSGLYGIEVNLTSHDSADDMDLPSEAMAVLQSRKKTGSLIESDLNDIDKLKYIVVSFLDLKPWSNSRSKDRASWAKYMKPVGKDGKRSKSPSLRATLQSLVVRHQMDVIHSEIPLPKLHKSVVYLEPTFFDKLNLNLFIFIIAVNAITSERRDQDYMFHPRNRKHLALTISNFRQAGFWWAGSEGDIAEAIGAASRYMEKNWDKMSEADKALLTDGIETAKEAHGCESWNIFRKLSELGILVEKFPPEARNFWTLDSASSQHTYLLLGISQARQAQNFITSRLGTDSPEEGLPGEGIRVRHQLEGRGERPDLAAKRATPDRMIRTRLSRKLYTTSQVKALPAESPLKQTKFVATASAKLSYLLDRVQELQEKEKIIIFYDNNNSAFWIAEGLELLGVDFRIYANTLKPDQRAAYLTLFRESLEVRVLLMDLRQASRGLHLANASRIFIINPIWDPNIESQAIKRAHRIGQTFPVFVETLVLKDTLEDRILKRRKEMTNIEIQHAEKDLLDDSTMSAIIQSERFIPMYGCEGPARMRFLRHTTGFFDRHELLASEQSAGNAEDLPSLPQTRAVTPRKRRHESLCFDDNSSQKSETLFKRQPTRVTGSVMSTPSLFGGPAR